MKEPFQKSGEPSGIDAKDMGYPDRIHQDFDFDVAGLEGCRVEELLGIVDIPNPDNIPIFINLKVTGHSWQRFFVDIGIGIGIWEEWPYLEDNTDDEIRVVDYATLYQVKGQSIGSIQCRDAIFTITFESGAKLVLKSIDNSFDSESEIQIFPKDEE
jgi:hypothetical protein